MCNPPFYASEDEMFASAQLKGLPPLTACTGTQTEMIHAPDGEIGFTRQMLSESLKLRSRVQWYTTLCGKLATVQVLVKEISTVLGPSGNWAVTQFTQGATRRWAVGWSFSAWRPRMATCCVETASLSGCSPFAPEFVIHPVRDPGERVIYEVLKSIPALTNTRCDDPPGVYCEFSGNMWSRAWRRAAVRGAGSNVDTIVRMGVLLNIEEAQVVIRWIYGEDRVLYESFCEMVRRKVAM